MNELNLDTIFDLLLRDSPTCDALIDMNGIIYRCNDAYKNMLGYTKDELNGEKNSPCGTQEDTKAEISNIHQLFSGVVSDINYRSTRLTKDGKTLSVEVTALAYKDKQGNPIFILQRVNDITERILTEVTEKSMQLYLQTILDDMPMNIYFKDLESRFILVSKNDIEFLGCKSMDEVRGKTDYDFFQPIHADACMKDEQYIINTGNVIEKEEREVRKDGSITWVLTTKSPLRNPEGKTIGTYGISRDITAIKQAEAETKQLYKNLEEKNQKLEDTIDELNKTQNKLIFAEKMAALGNLIGGIAHEINTPLGAIKASSSNIQEVVEKINVDLPWLINHATPDEISWLFRLINESDARDISVFSKGERLRKRELASLFEANHIDNAYTIADTIVMLKLNQTDEEYIKLLSMPNSQHLLQMLKVLFSLKRNANNIFVSVEKASVVVRALKNYIYKNGQGENEATNVVETIETVLILTSNMIKHTKTEISTNFNPIPMIFCRQDEMCQVWTNLMTNAIQAMGESGQLEIGVKTLDPERILIWFKDNGPGIPDDVKARIFEPYFTTKAKGIGTGMGLDISRQIIDSHNGRIYVESAVGTGTTFFIEIPVNQEPTKKQTKNI